MKSQKIPRKSRGVSPVIATVVLVAVTITVAVAVSYWMSGIAGQYTAFEKVEIQTGYAKIVTDKGWNITMTLKNTGSAAATLTHVFINEEPVDKYGDANNVIIFGTTVTAVDSDETGVNFNVATGLTLESGEEEELYILIGDAVGELSSGTTVNIKIHSASGMDYIKLIKLV